MALESTKRKAAQHCPERLGLRIRPRLVGSGCGVTQDLSDGEDAPFADRLQRSRTAQHPGRKHNDAAYHPKYSVDRNPRNAERNQKDPHERVRDQRE
jgi:hypothetical protein